MSAAGRRKFDWAEVGRRLDEAHRSLDVEAVPDPERERLTLHERARELAGRSFDAHVAHDRELISFGLAGGSYALDSARVLEISHARELAPLPGAPFPLLGVVPWRGSILLLLDLAAMLGRDASYPERPLLVVLDGAEAPFGVAVDAVRDVLLIRDADVRPVPEMIHTNGELVTGVVNGDVMILDGDALLRGRTPPR